MFRMLIASICMLISLGLCSCAKEANPPNDGNHQPADAGPKPVEKPQAKAPAPEEILRQVADFYSSLKSLEVRSEKTIQVEIDGNGGEPARQTATFVAESPDRLFVQIRDEFSSASFHFDGTSLTTWLPELQKYTQVAASGSLDDVLRDQQRSRQFVLMVTSGSPGPSLLQLIADDPYTKMTQNVTASEYAGLEQLDGAGAHRVRFKQQMPHAGLSFDWEMWVAADGDPVVKQITKTILNSGTGDNQGPQIKSVTTETFTGWKFNEPIPGEMFSFTPPEGAEKVDNLFAEAGNRPAGRPQQPEAEPVPSSGNPVIDFFRAVDRGVKSTTPEKENPEPSDADDENSQEEK